MLIMMLLIMIMMHLLSIFELSHMLILLLWSHCFPTITEG